MKIFIIAAIFWASNLNAPIKFFEHKKFINTYYVSTPGNGGSDSNPGTSGSPFATLSKAESVVVAGDIVNVNAGTYTISSLTMSHNGSAGNPITFQTTGAVTVNCTSNGFAVSGSWRVIKGFSFTGTFTAAIDVSTANNIIQNVTVTQGAATGYGLKIGPDANTGGTAANTNTLDNVRVIGTNTGTVHGIIFGGGGTGNVLKNSYISGTYYGLVDKAEISTLCFNNVFNFTSASEFVCMYDKGATNSSYYNNICRNTGSGYGFLIQNDGAGGPNPTGAILKNNLFIKNSNAAIISGSGGATSTFTSDYNCYQYSSGFVVELNPGTDYSTLAAWQATGQDAHSIAATPLFTNGSGTLTAIADFKPASSSPVINVGVAIGGRSTDALGQSIVSTPDMGALEFQSGATVYYIATNGDNSWDGLAAVHTPSTTHGPWLTMEKIASIAFVAGDIVYIRAGVYNSTTTTANQRCINIVNQHGNSSAHILISAYPPDFPSGGRVTYNCTNVAHDDNAMGIVVENCSYIDFTGIWVKGPTQTLGKVESACSCRDGSIVIGWWDISSPNVTYNNCEASLSGNGFRLDAGNDVTYNNCDSHDNNDPLTGGTTGPNNNSDGFERTDNSNTATRTVYNYCRSWHNSDDGWDCYGTNGIITYNGCWSFQNGYYFNGTSYVIGGDGNGYKMAGGPTNVVGSITRFANNSLAVANTAHGFDQNDGTFIAQFWNCDAINNGQNDWKFGYHPVLGHDFRNNVSFGNANIGFAAGDGGGGNWNPNTNNTWNGAVTVTAADFNSLDVTQLDDPRQVDGSLPIVTFGTLKSGSDLIDAGTNVGIAFIGSAPDMGAFEFTTGSSSGGDPIGGGGGGTVDTDTKLLKTGKVHN